VGSIGMSRDSVLNNAKALEGLEIGSTTIINGLTICRERECSFHLRMPDGAMFGSARNVAEWLELVNKTFWQSHSS
jgi:hypothetical protein